MNAPTWEDVIREAVRCELAAVHVSLPAVVVSYDPASQRATVQPVIRGRFRDPVTGREAPDPSLPPPIPNLPVVWPSGHGGDVSLTMGLEKGDPVTLVVQERSTDEWRASGRTDNAPLDGRRFDLSDAVVYPGGRTFAPGPRGPLPSSAWAADGGPVLAGTAARPVRLGGSGANQRVIQGDAFIGDLDAMLGAFETFLNACSLAVDAAQIAAAAGAFLPYVVDLRSATFNRTHLSDTVKVTP